MLSSTKAIDGYVLDVRWRLPVKPKSPCSKSNCPNLASKHGLCEQHVREYNERRYSEPTLYDARWQKARLLFLQEHPFCSECLKEGKTVMAEVVDHVIPHRGDKKLFWLTSNWDSKCKRHHDIKTAKGE